MADNSTNNNPAQEKANIRSDKITAGISGLVILVVSIAVIFGTEDLTSAELVTTYLSVMLFVAVIVSRVINLGGIRNKPLLFMTAYHLIFNAMQLAVFAPSSILSFLWIPLAVRTQYLLDQTWAYTWYAIFAINSLFGFIITNNRSELDFYTIISVIGIGFVVTLMVNSSRGNEKKQVKESTVELKQTHSDLEEFEIVLNSMNEAVAGLDPDGTIRVYNHAMKTMVGRNSDLHGQHIDSTLTLLDDKRQPYKLYSLLKKGVETNDNDLFIYYGGEDYKPVSIKITPTQIMSSDDKHIAYSLVLSDDSRAKQASTEQNEFLENVAQELRTPVGVAAGHISNALLVNQYGSKDRDLDHALKVAQEQVGYVSSMMNDLDALSKAQKDVIEMESAAFHPSEVVKELEAKFSEMATKKHLEFRTVLNPNLRSINTSKQYVLDILDNVLDNAFKYTAKGSVVLSADISGKSVSFSVRDTGVGMNKADLPQLFDKFYRSENVKAYGIGGSGLGLYISKKLADRMGATLVADSELNKGSVFTLTI